MPEKPYAPTARRLKRARRHGHVPLSTGLVQGLSFCVVLVSLPSMAEALVALFRRYLQDALNQRPRVDMATELVTDVLLLTLPVLLPAAITAVAVTLLQTGSALAPRRMAFALSHLRSRTGVAGLPSRERAADLLQSMLVRGALVVAACWLFVAQSRSIASTVGNAKAACYLAGDSAERLGWVVAAAAVLVGCAHWASVRASWWRSLRLTGEEWRRELREVEGDPAVRAARSRVHRGFLGLAAGSTLADADLLVLDGDRGLVALRYRAESDRTPLVLARWEAREAPRIVQQAEALGMSVVAEPALARALRPIGVGAPVPESTYESIAELLAAAHHRRVVDRGLER